MIEREVSPPPPAPPQSTLRVLSAPYHRGTESLSDAKENGWGGGGRPDCCATLAGNLGERGGREQAAAPPPQPPPRLKPPPSCCGRGCFWAEDRGDRRRIRRRGALPRGEGQGAGFQETSLALRAGELRRPNGVKARGSCRARCKEASAARPWRAVGDSQDGAAGTPRAVGRPEGPGGGRGTRVIQPCQQHALGLPGFVRRSEDGDRGLGVRGRGEEAHGKESEIWGPSLKKKNRAREEAIASGRSEVSTREGILKPSLRAALRPPASQRGSDVLNENKVGSARLSPRRVTTRTFFQERRAGGYRRRRQLRKEVRGEGPDRGQGCCTSILSAPEKPSQKRNPCKQIQLPTDWKLLCHCFM
ncbi:uncharacterized protein LOC122674713 [Cervus elaphus]|uniref:uncharacterized protein LOC122674713 n=1 Tax=Cervus elaphus TaxID=9860 RepID=UPI001CC2793C|nr:uncharacterized protein LOC122674713 [Cervus elaphus]